MSMLFCKREAGDRFTVPRNRRISRSSEIAKNCCGENHVSIDSLSNDAPPLKELLTDLLPILDWTICTLRQEWSQATQEKSYIWLFQRQLAIKAEKIRNKINHLQMYLFRQDVSLQTRIFLVRMSRISSKLQSGDITNLNRFLPRP